MIRRGRNRSWANRIDGSLDPEYVGCQIRDFGGIIAGSIRAKGFSKLTPRRNRGDRYRMRRPLGCRVPARLVSRSAQALRNTATPISYYATNGIGIDFLKISLWGILEIPASNCFKKRGAGWSFPCPTNNQISAITFRFAAVSPAMYRCVVASEECPASS